MTKAKNKLIVRGLNFHS